MSFLYCYFEVTQVKRIFNKNRMILVKVSRLAGAYVIKDRMKGEMDSKLLFGCSSPTLVFDDSLFACCVSFHTILASDD